jgi:hypothetical protein
VIEDVIGHRAELDLYAIHGCIERLVEVEIGLVEVGRAVKQTCASQSPNIATAAS